MTNIDYQQLADLLFPHVTETPEEVEARFPARNLPEGAKVTRFAPSPTGFVHFGEKLILFFHDVMVLKFRCKVTIIQRSVQ